ncbi:hypothetical protein ACK8N7_23130 [Streptomyces griseobrunneus]
MPDTISEPELIGEFGPEHTAEAVGGFDRKPPSGRRSGHGLLWGVAGALAASAVWVTAVFAYGDGVTRKPGRARPPGGRPLVFRDAAEGVDRVRGEA